MRASNTAFFGFVLTEQGIQIDPDKQERITEMQAPGDVVGLKSFLGMMSHVSRFIPRLSEVVAPLRELCRKETQWRWTQEHGESFRRATELVAHNPSLAFFDPAKPVEVVCDASKNGLGAALVQEGRPVYFASRAMTVTETRYAMVVKELLAVRYALKRFHYFIFPKPVTVFTDHKPLVNIISKALDDVPLRLQRMLMDIQRYNVRLLYRPGKEIRYADELSRCPMRNGRPSTGEEEEVKVIETLPMRDKTLEKVRCEARTDDTYRKLLETTRSGWPESERRLDPDLNEFFPYRNRFTIEGDLLLKDNAVVIPKRLRAEMLKRLCGAHHAANKTVERAKTCVFWPRIRSDIEDSVDQCEGCRRFPDPQRKEPMLPHEIPVRPWQKVGMDIVTTDTGKFLILICYYSNLIMVSELSCRPTTRHIARKLARVFSDYGACDVLVADSDPLFRAQEFALFTQKWNIQLRMSSPHFHQSNGKAEAAVAIVKKIMRRSRAAGEDWRPALLAYNDTP